MLFREWKGAPPLMLALVAATQVRPSRVLQTTDVTTRKHAPVTTYSRESTNDPRAPSWSRQKAIFTKRRVLRAISLLADGAKNPDIGAKILSGCALSSYNSYISSRSLN